MQFNPPLQRGVLLRRYKRFLADIELSNGDHITIHCPNTGAMTGCAEPGSEVWFSTSDNPKRKYPHTWELTRTAENAWICVNTARANELVTEAIQRSQVAELAGYNKIQREVKYAEGSRVDLLLSDHAKLPNAYVEVKSVTLCDETQSTTHNGFFPDAVSTRGHKHLQALTSMVAAGQRAVLVYAVLHSQIHSVTSAVHIDATYAELAEQAKHAGVEILPLFFSISELEISLQATHFRNAHS
ncbi:DNA/RNA nuclease SfsA [Aliidiomarina haloalkalitolerans]|uniref:Sugar fermentation stimulation protein homolog n=1 Tax=Aliidiomarina haloalkalitolerans TaxID=859059 RepID=A0A432VTW1_9GAMM|nr:DNA/RNA nuclease SfsA [Aliidiomarina haloalkalitolerans]RUO19776.1 DNA/RNA nuclease SfsA [Aliidiomarina haloalkalitolerans]